MSVPRATLIHWMGPEHINSAGFVHGGAILRIVDEVAGLAAIGHCGSPQQMVTAALDRVTFRAPLKDRDLVTFMASVNAVWNSSLEVGVKVTGEDPVSGQLQHSHSAYLTMVVVGPDRKPVSVPPLVIDPDDREALRRQTEAQIRRDYRRAEQAAIAAARER